MAGAYQSHREIHRSSALDAASLGFSPAPSACTDRAHLDRVAALVTTGVVRVPEITTYKLSEAAKAHAVSEGRHLRGKLVFTVR